LISIPILSAGGRWIVLTETKFADIIFNSLYAPDLVAMLPLAIHQAYSEDNFAPLITQASLLNAGLYDGMFYAVACSEDAPFVTGAEDPTVCLKQRTKLRRYAQCPAEICRSYATNRIGRSALPYPMRRPDHAALACRQQRITSNGARDFQRDGAGNSGSDCTSRIIARFIENGSTVSLDTTCVKNVGPPPFFVDFSGPEP
jgi:hypothetical protein